MYLTKINKELLYHFKKTYCLPLYFLNLCTLYILGLFIKKLHKINFKEYFYRQIESTEATTTSPGVSSVSSNQSSLARYKRSLGKYYNNNKLIFQ